MGLSDLYILASILGDKTRNQILEYLLESHRTIDELAEKIGVSRTAIEKHINILLRYGLVERRAPSIGRLKYYYYINESAETFLESFILTAENYVSYRLDEVIDTINKLEQAKQLGLLTDDEIKLRLEQLYEMKTKLEMMMGKKGGEELKTD